MNSHDGVQTPGALPPSSDSAFVELEWQYHISGGLKLSDDMEIRRFFRPGSRNDKKVFDLAPRYEFAIQTWNPSDGLFRRILQGLDRFTDHVGAGLPLKRVQVGSHLGDIVKISAEVFSPGSLLIRITARFRIEFHKEDYSSFYKSLSELRSPRKLEPIHSIYQVVLEHLVEDGTNLRRPSVRFACFIKLPLDDTEYRRGAQRSRQALVAFHIGAQKAQEIAISLVDDIEERCRSLNLKSNTETMIANAQGITYIIPTVGHTTPHNERFRKATDLLSVAAYCQDVLLDFDDLQNSTPAAWLKQIRIARRWIQYSANTFHSSVGNRALWDVLVDAFHLNSFVSEMLALNEISWER